ncbi:MAG: hypothetical protein ACHBMF_08555 [Chromatiales bacterium]
MPRRLTIEQLLKLLGKVLETQRLPDETIKTRLANLLYSSGSTLAIRATSNALTGSGPEISVSNISGRDALSTPLPGTEYEPAERPAFHPGDNL